MKSTPLCTAGQVAWHLGLAACVCTDVYRMSLHWAGDSLMSPVKEKAADLASRLPAGALFIDCLQWCVIPLACCSDRSSLNVHIQCHPAHHQHPCPQHILIRRPFPVIFFKFNVLTAGICVPVILRNLLSVYREMNSLWWGPSCDSFSQKLQHCGMRYGLAEVDRIPVVYAPS